MEIGFGDSWQPQIFPGLQRLAQSGDQFGSKGGAVFMCIKRDVLLRIKVRSSLFP